jgi:hypothetical protein
MFPVPMTPTVLPCKSNPEVPLMKSFVLALDYMLYAFYDLKSISWPWRAQLQPRENRSEHDTLITFWAATTSTLLKPAQRKAIISTPFSASFNDFSIYNINKNAHNSTLALNL